MKPGSLFRLATICVAFAGCGPEPVVEERPSNVRTEVEVDRPPATVIERQREPANTGVDLQVGGGRGVDVNVTPPANKDTNPNP